MLQPPPISIGFLIDDLKWSNSLERLRAPASQWQSVVLNDWSDLFDLAARESYSLSVVEVALAEPAVWLRQLGKLGRSMPGHRLIVVGSSELRPLAGVFHELGVVACGFSVGDCPRLVGLIEQLIRSRPPHSLGLRESIIRSLPWPEAASNTAVK